MNASLRRFLHGETVVRHVPDREHDNLDLAVVAGLSSRWAADPDRFPSGPCNLAGRRRSLHATLDALARAAAEHGGTARYQDRWAPPMPWPWLDDRHLREGCEVPAERDDFAIARDYYAGGGC